ncbi:hypothetical protein [Mesonia mobilis]|uniref:Uncharacterized protein n=1 Tax=Mesonia mobilis TaxID=369791 RepID=A0ABQ3BV10_9FLAO|nr:hypothetical protein [Mesonia mobilis]MBQ0738293.1 hypothetical protein [Aquimarina celericrescens]GGZ58367.1 hypothetical protein GCM10008088_19920 [Mesonia mobilis]
MERRDFTTYLLATEETSFRISYFKELFNPKDLAEILDSLSETGIVEVDWDKKLIIKKLDVEKILISKNKLKRKKSEKPSYMKADQTEINKPYM